MGRKRVELSSADEAEIATRSARSESVRTIESALAGRVSRATIDRRVRELKAGTPQKRSRRPGGIPAAPPTPKPDSVDAEDIPVNPPDGTPLETIDRWLARVELAATQAEKTGNLQAISSLSMRAASLTEARRKAMPLPKPDPNDDPDMIEMGALAEKRLFQLIDDALRPTGAR
jgi:hypothetical protein